MPYAALPMSSTAMPGIARSPSGIVIASTPSGPRLGPVPKVIALSQ